MLTYRWELRYIFLVSSINIIHCLLHVIRPTHSFTGSVWFSRVIQRFFHRRIFKKGFFIFNSEILTNFFTTILIFSPFFPVICHVFKFSVLHYFVLGLPFDRFIIPSIIKPCVNSSTRLNVRLFICHLFSFKMSIYVRFLSLLLSRGLRSSFSPTNSLQFSPTPQFLNF